MYPKCPLCSKLICLYENLLSVWKLVENGYSLKFEDNSCSIYDKGYDRLLLTKLKMENRSFRLNFKHANDVTLKNIQANDDSWLWHQRLEHLNCKVSSCSIRKIWCKDTQS